MSTPITNAPAQVDIIRGGKGYGDVAARMLAGNMSLQTLRANATTLFTNDWEELDKAVVKVARAGLVGINDLRSRGLEKPINGLARTTFSWNTLGDWNDAEVGMSPEYQTGNDNLNFVQNWVPLPLIHKDFSIGIRELNESRNNGEAIDTIGAELATQKVVEKAEEILIAGLSSYQFNGRILYGLCDHPNVNVVTLSTYGNWDASGGTGVQVLKCVNAMIQASINDNYLGPWGLYIPQAYASVLNYDFKTYGSVTIGEMLRKIEGIEFVKVNPKLAANTVLLVPLSLTQVRIIVGLDVTNFPWEETPFRLRHKVAAIFVPWVQADQSGKTGLVKAA